MSAADAGQCFQAFGCFNIVFRESDLLLGEISFGFAAETTPRGGKPVSYTHLDVYKRQGLLREVISLATWIAAFAIAFLFSADGAALLTPYIDIPPLRVAAAFGGLFLATLLLGGLLGILASYLVDYTGLNGTCLLYTSRCV